MHRTWSLCHVHHEACRHGCGGALAWADRGCAHYAKHSTKEPKLESIGMLTTLRSASSCTLSHQQMMHMTRALKGTTVQTQKVWCGQVQTVIGHARKVRVSISLCNNHQIGVRAGQQPEVGSMLQLYSKSNPTFRSSDFHYSRQPTNWQPTSRYSRRPNSTTLNHLTSTTVYSSTSIAVDRPTSAILNNSTVDKPNFCYSQ